MPLAGSCRWQPYAAGSPKPLPGTLQLQLAGRAQRPRSTAQHSICLSALHCPAAPCVLLSTDGNGRSAATARVCPPALQVSGELGSSYNDVVAPQVGALAGWGWLGLSWQPGGMAGWLAGGPDGAWLLEGLRGCHWRCFRHRRTAAPYSSACLPALPALRAHLVPQDVAVYGALCGMAALGRAELSARLLNNVAFRELLEGVPDVSNMAQLRPVDRHLLQLALAAHRLRKFASCHVLPPPSGTACATRPYNHPPMPGFACRCGRPWPTSTPPTTPHASTTWTGSGGRPPLLANGPPTPAAGSPKLPSLSSQALPLCQAPLPVPHCHLPLLPACLPPPAAARLTDCLTACLTD